MMRTMWLLGLALILGTGTGCGGVGMPPPWGQNFSEIDVAPVVEVGGAAFVVEVADDRREREKGLSGRAHLDPETGMLFVPEDGGGGAFWMKGMLFPLDFIWVGEQCEVVGVMKDVPFPQAGTPDVRLPIYEFAPSTRYALEVNAGDVDRFNIGTGDSVTMKGLDELECGETEGR